MSPSSVREQLKECLSGAHHEGRFCAAALGPLMIAVFDRATTDKDADAVARVLAQVAKAHPSIAMLSVVGPDTPPPDGAVRDRLTREVKLIQPQLVAAATVIEGSGFRAAAMRAAVTGMTLLLRASYPAKTFATVQESGEFLATVTSLSVDEVTLAVEKLRAVP